MAYDSEIDEKAQLRIDLERGREHIARGWTQGELWSDDGERVCIFGGIIRGLGAGDKIPADPGQHRRISLAARALERHTPPWNGEKCWGNKDAVSFNNDPATTQADVLGLFDMTIEAL